MTLNEAKVGGKYKVKGILGRGPLRKRILDMGLTKNTEFFVRKAAPLGDPVQISIRGYELTIRKHDGEQVEIESI